MNTKLLNVVSLDDGRIIKKGASGGGGGGVTINNQSKSVDITENGTTEVTADTGYTGLGKVTINTNVASSGGGSATSVPRKAVNFIDYDGTTLYSYTKEEFLALSQLPKLPTHQGLICQEWNWSLEGAQSYVRDYGKQEIGATYITDDGKTRLYIKIATRGRMDVPLYFNQTVANGVTIDWGDGSAPQTLSGTGDKNTTHTYADTGEYVISLNPADGCTLGLGHGSSSYCVMGSTGERSKVYSNMLQAVEIGNGVTSIGSNAFYFCYSLASVVIPNSVTSIGSNAFYFCYSLASVVIPNSVTSIGSKAFYNCYGMAIYDFSQCASVPTISSDSFLYLPSDCKFMIPDALFDEWESATNWSSYASKMVKASEFNG